MQRVASLLIAISSTLFLANCSSFMGKTSNSFSYQNLYQSQYVEGTGGEIPVTINRGESSSGSVSTKGDYLLYSSNEDGTYNLYYKPLNSVRSYPFLIAASNQKEPVISPDGRTIAMVDDELDPDGDIVIMSARFSSIKNAANKADAAEKNRYHRKFITNSEKKRVRSRDSNPVFSTDSRYLAWASDMQQFPGEPFGPEPGTPQNIWIMEVGKPSTARKLTESGGVMPSFSPDGKSIVFVSYPEASSNGDIFSVHLETGKTERITNTQYLEMFPQYTANGQAVLYTLVEKDTNGNGYLDRKDSGKIFHRNLPTARPLLLGKKDEQQILSADLLPVSPENMNVISARQSSFLGGTLLFSKSDGDNINISLMPEYGPVPGRSDISEQRELSKELLKSAITAEDRSAYLQSLDLYPILHGTDPLFPVFASEALIQNHEGRKKWGYSTELTTRLIETMAEEKSPALLILAEYHARYIGQNDLQAFLSANSPYKPASGESPGDYLVRMSQLAEIQEYYEPYTLSEIRSQLENHYSVAHLSSREKDKLSEELAAKAARRTVSVQNFLKETAGLHKLSEGNLPKAMEILGSSLTENYDRSNRVLWEIAKANTATTFSPELLFFTEADQKYLAPQYPAAFRDFAQKHSTEQLSADARRFALEHAISILENRQLELYDSMLSANKKTVAEALLHAAKGEVLLREKNADAATIPIAELEKQKDKNEYLNYLYHKLKGKKEEITGNRSTTFASYREAIQFYDAGFKDPEYPSMYESTIAYYSQRGQELESGRQFSKAWEMYRSVLDLSLSKSVKNTLTRTEKNTLLSAALRSSDLAVRMRTEDEKLHKNILKYFEKNLDKGRLGLNTPFIFSRAYLLTQRGASMHQEYEKKGLSNSQKEEVLKQFFAAESDYYWTFFTDPDFFDSYVMLGWMYQYIDNQKDKMTGSLQKQKDRERFQLLYAKYFPEYLYEKNIALYQKIIAQFSGTVPSATIASFHLNMGNNYYLLSNFAKAEEHYSLVSEEIQADRFVFSNKKQEAIFHFNYGRSLYFTGKYRESTASYDKAVSVYETMLSRKSGNERKEIFAKLELLDKYRAVNFDLSGNSVQAIETLENILTRQNAAGYRSDRSYVHMELSRHYLAALDYDKALLNVNQAETALRSEEETKAPKYYVRLKLLGIEQPWTWLLGLVYSLNSDMVYQGQNHIVFPVPTIHRKEFIHSVRAQIFKERGVSNSEADSLEQLRLVAEKDKSKIGREALVNVYFRQAANFYENGNLDVAEKTIQKAFKLAEKMKNPDALEKARKNLLYITARRIDAPSTPANERKKIAQTTLKNLNQFIKDYEKEAIDLAEEKLKKKNKKLRLTDSEKALIRFESAKTLYPHHLFRAGFETVLFQSAQADFITSLKPESLEKFESSHREMLTRTELPSRLYSGKIPNPGLTDKKNAKLEYVDFTDPKNQRLKIGMGLNRGTLYEFMGRTKPALSEFSLAGRRAFEFQSAPLQTYSILKLSQYQEAEKDVSPESVSALLNEYSERPAMLKLRQQEFIELSRYLAGRRADAGDYEAAITILDASRKKLAALTFSEGLQKYARSHSPNLERFLYLQHLDSQLSQMREDYFFAKENAEKLGKQIVSLREEKSILLQGLKQEPDSRMIVGSLIDSGNRSLPSVDFLYLYGTTEEWRAIARQSSNGQADWTRHRFKPGDWESVLSFLEQENISVLFLPENVNIQSLKLPPTIQFYFSGYDFHAFRQNKTVSDYKIHQYALNGEGKENLDRETTVSETEADLEKFPEAAIWDIESAYIGNLSAIDASGIPLRLYANAAFRPASVYYSEASDSTTMAAYYHRLANTYLLAGSGAAKIYYTGLPRKKAVKEIRASLDGNTNLPVAGNPAVVSGSPQERNTLYADDARYFKSLSEKSRQKGEIQKASAYFSRAWDSNQKSGLDEDISMAAYRYALWLSEGKTEEGKSGFRTLLEKNTFSEKMSSDYLAALIRYADADTARTEHDWLTDNAVKFSPPSRALLQASYYAQKMENGNIEGLAANSPEFIADDSSWTVERKLNHLMDKLPSRENSIHLLAAREFSKNRFGLTEEEKLFARLLERVLNDEQTAVIENEFSSHADGRIAEIIALLHLKDSGDDEKIQEQFSAYLKRINSDTPVDFLVEDILLTALQKTASPVSQTGKEYAKVNSLIVSHAKDRLKQTKNIQRRNFYAILSHQETGAAHLSAILNFNPEILSSGNRSTWIIAAARQIYHSPELLETSIPMSAYPVDRDYRKILELSNQKADAMAKPLTSAAADFSVRYYLSTKNPAKALSAWLHYDRNISLEDLPSDTKGVFELEGRVYEWSSGILKLSSQEAARLYAEKTKAEKEYWYLPANPGHSLENLPWQSGRIWITGTKRPDTTVSKTWKAQAANEYSGILTITLGKPSLKAAEINLGNTPDAHSLLHVQTGVSSLRSLAGAGTNSYLLAYTREELKGVYLKFLEIYTTKIAAGDTVEKAFVASQKEIAGSLLNPSDAASIVLVRQ